MKFISKLHTNGDLIQISVKILLISPRWNASEFSKIYIQQNQLIIINTKFCRIFHGYFSGIKNHL